MSTFHKLIPIVLLGGAIGVALAQPHPPALRAKAGGATTAGLFVHCDGKEDCDTAITQRKLACTQTVSCDTNHECQFAVGPGATCACYETDVRLCPNNADQLQFCVELSPSTTQWQRNGSADVCGPSQVACSTGNPTCPAGFQTTKFDGNTWAPQGACVPQPACPAKDSQRACQSGNPECPHGTQTFDGNNWSACQAIGCPGVGARQVCATGRAECPNGQRTWNGSSWSACTAIGCPGVGDKRGCPSGNPSCPQGIQTWTGSTWSPCQAINCPLECSPGMRLGSSQPCNTSEGCQGRQTCNQVGANAASWGACMGAPRACPAGWRHEGNSCAWTSSTEHSHVTYFPHRADNEKVAATGSIGNPHVVTPIYVEVALSQWSNPPADNHGGNHCGKGDFVSAWVGCIRPGGARGYGRDVHDNEWQNHVTIPLRCESNDSVGVYKHTWGHDAFWHCTRDMELRVVRNHDPLPTCHY